MSPDYDTKFTLGRFFLAKEKGGAWFIGKSCYGYYVALFASDLNPWRRSQTKTLFWQELFK